MDRLSNRPQGLVAAMLDPGLYPNAPRRVELRETHISWVFLAGEFAYKVKKPLVLPFLDYGTLERRREMCREEVRLNRRLAPAYYLGVDSIVRGPGGLRLVASDEAGAVEYAVRMRRVPEERTLESLAAQGGPSEAVIDEVAARIATFHLASEPAHRRLEDLVEPFEENLETLRAAAHGALADDRLRAAECFTAAFLAARHGQITARAGAGLVRDCHGDLRAEHVIVDGEVVVYDCIEFNPSLRLIDVAADLAFLVMDLARLGREDVASRLVASYRSAGGDPGDDALLYPYAAYRAWVRAKVALLRAGELAEGDERDRARRDAAGMLALGHRLAWRARLPAVIAVCGVAASGKTALASRLSEISGLPRLSSDVKRKCLAGLPPAERASPEVYSEEFTLRTYRELGRLARWELERAGGAIVDATFHLARERRAFEAGMGGAGAPVLFAECRAPTALLLRRAGARAGRAEGASDADPAIVRRQLAELEPLDEIAPELRLAIATDRSIEAEVLEVERLANGTLVPDAAGGEPPEGARPS